MPGRDPRQLDLGLRVGWELTDLIARRGKPGDCFSQWHCVHLACDLRLGEDHAIDWHYMAAGKPMQNGFVESFNGRMPMIC